MCHRRTKTTTNKPHLRLRELVKIARLDWRTSCRQPEKKKHKPSVLDVTPFSRLRVFFVWFSEYESIRSKTTWLFGPGNTRRRLWRRLYERIRYEWSPHYDYHWCKIASGWRTENKKTWRRRRRIIESLLRSTQVSYKNAEVTATTKAYYHHWRKRINDDDSRSVSGLLDVGDDDFLRPAEMDDDRSRWWMWTRTVRYPQYEVRIGLFSYKI